MQEDILSEQTFINIYMRTEASLLGFKNVNAE
jgi:hypothetical protein